MSLVKCALKQKVYMKRGIIDITFNISTILWNWAQTKIELKQNRGNS